MKKGDRVYIMSNIPFTLRHRKKPVTGRVISVDGYYVIVRPSWCRWEGEWYKNELKKI